jgi:hypothetical protein
MASSSSDPPPWVNGLSEGDIAKIVAALRNAKVVDDIMKRDKDRDKDKDGKRYWKTSDVGYFWPDMPLSYGAGRVIDFHGAVRNGSREILRGVSKRDESERYLEKYLERRHGTRTRGYISRTRRGEGVLVQKSELLRGEL